MNAAAKPPVRTRDFHLTVLGRTLEHLGVQMYKRRDTAIAELVANAWDAGAETVKVVIPVDGYDQESSEILIEDDGSGMDDDAVQKYYLVVGRNRRQDGEPEPEGRPVMGRKGIGKLAGFGIAKTMRVETWAANQTTTFALDMDQLKAEDGETEEVPIAGEISEGLPDGVISETGTRLILTRLKHKTPIEVDTLKRALGRRFSRTVRGAMTIRVNDDEIEEPEWDFEFRDPETNGEVTEATLSDGGTVRFWYGFTEDPIPHSLLRGWTILVRGKTAQAPNFYFNVEGTASGQHGTKYLTGVIEADYLDDGTDDESDLISTDRQEIDWEDERTAPLMKWGDELTRKALRERVDRRGDETVEYIYDQPDFKARIERLEDGPKTQIEQYLKLLGEADPEDKKKNALADSLIRAFEYRHFHDVVAEIEAAGAESPEQLEQLLTYLHEWKVLESRAILEIVKGRLEIIDKFALLLAEDAPETAHMKGDDNLHDLLAEYPWLINPDWQVLVEEKRITTLLAEWEAEIEDPDDKQRVDFLALAGEGTIKLIEIKRAGHQVTLEEIQRLDQYRSKLQKAEKRPVESVLIFGGDFAFDNPRTDIEELKWPEIQERARRHYEHYQAVLEGRIVDESFARKETELLRTREIATEGTVWRGPERRKKGLGPQDIAIAAGGELVADAPGDPAVSESDALGEDSDGVAEPGAEDTHEGGQAEDVSRRGE